MRGPPYTPIDSSRRGRDARDKTITDPGLPGRIRSSLAAGPDSRGLRAFFECREVTCPGLGMADLLRWLRDPASGRAISRFRQDIDPRVRPGEPPPHVIAYGMGAYYVAQSLRPRSEPVPVGRIALVGCPLHRRFPWDVILGQQPFAFTVRNELVRPRLPLRAAGWLAWREYGLGDAGLRGFLGPADLVHTTPADADPLGPCGSCGPPLQEPLARVHNAHLGEYARDAFLGVWHALDLWLPFLWDLAANDLWDFIDFCRACAKEESLHGETSRVWVLEAALAEQPWRFLGRLYPTQPEDSRRDLQTVLANRLFKWNDPDRYSQTGPLSVTSERNSRQFLDQDGNPLPRRIHDRLEEQVGRAIRALRQGVVAAYRELFARLMDRFEIRLPDIYWQDDLQQYRTSSTRGADGADHKIGLIHPGTALSAAVASVAGPLSGGALK